MSTGKIIAAVIGSLLSLAAVGLLIAGVMLIVLQTALGDDEGYISSPTFELESDGYALVSEDIDVVVQPGDWWPAGLAAMRIDAEPDDGAPVFVGIGPSGDVDDYLSEVARDVITRMGPGRTDVEYRSFSGGAPDAAPGDQDFWVVSAEGAGEQTITWDVEPGGWTVVVMNADASQGVDVDARGAAQLRILLPIGIILTVAGVLVAVVAALLLVYAVRRDPNAPPPNSAGITDLSRPGPAATGEPPVRPGNYPVLVEGALDPGLSRWHWLVKWVLAIPHYIVLSFLWITFFVLTVIAFFGILINGRYPRAIFEFNVGVMRWSWRVAFYAFGPMSTGVLGTDRYPPFTLHDADYPANLHVEYPAELSRGLVLIKWWLLAIPHYLLVWAFDALIGLLVLIAAVVLLFTGRYPADIFDLVMGLNRWVYRVIAYAGLTRDEYPPFRLDNGSPDPGRASATQEPARV
ncbi:MAG: DUF4389 domain-containing protein [Dehalococcoidia bacterium]